MTDLRVALLERMTKLHQRCLALASLKDFEAPFATLEPERIRFSLGTRLSQGLEDEAENIYAEYAIRVNEIIMGKAPQPVRFQGVVNYDDVKFVQPMRERVKKLIADTPWDGRYQHAWDWAARLAEDVARLTQQYKAMLDLIAFQMEGKPIE